jgi:hypothetical protein
MPLSHGQKVFFVTATAVIALSAVFLSIRKVSRGLTLTPPPSPVASSPTRSTPSPFEHLKTKDTDGDGLSDYDELFTYQTSPYLKDSDSDGIADAVEVQRATNPNCPEGTNCLTRGGLLNPATAPTTPGALPTLAPRRTPGSGVGGVQQPAPETQLAAEQLLKLMEGKATASELRAYLTQQGASGSDLSRIDDATLLELYGKALGEMRQVGEPSNAPALPIAPPAGNVSTPATQ